MSGVHADSERPPQTLEERPRTLQEKKAETDLGGADLETSQDIEAWGATTRRESREPGTTLIYVGVIIGLIVVAFAAAQFWPVETTLPSEQAPAVSEQPADTTQ